MTPESCKDPQRECNLPQVELKLAGWGERLKNIEGAVNETRGDVRTMREAMQGTNGNPGWGTRLRLIEETEERRKDRERSRGKIQGAIVIGIAMLIISRLWELITGVV